MSRTSPWTLRHLTATTALVISALASAVPTPSVAQDAQRDPRWQPWLGCWQPTRAPMAPAGAPSLSLAAPNPPLPEPTAGGGGPLVCVVPAGGDAGTTAASTVGVATVVDGKIVAAERIDASGETRSRSGDGCTGWQRAEWSADGRRLYVRSEDTCPGGLARTATGLLAISPEGEWLDVRTVTAGGRTSVRVLRYRDAGVPSAVPPDIARAIGGRSLATSAARTGAGMPLTAADVVEASRRVDVAAVEAWLVEEGQGFSLDAKQLLSLADAGVPGRVTDLMVALSYPRTFTVNPVSREANGVGGNDPSRATSAYAGVGRRLPAALDPYLYPSYGSFGYASRYGPYGSSLYGYGSGYGLGYGLGYGWYANRPPIVIVRQGGAASPHGRAVNGSGYTRDPNGGAGTAGPRASSATVGGGHESAGGGRGQGGAGSGPTRTAHPRR